MKAIPQFLATLLMASIMGSAQAGIIINEILQNPSAVSDSAGEWFELYNSGSTDININGWRISDNDFDAHTINNGGALVISAGGYLTLGINGDTSTNGGVPIGYEYSGLFLGNSSDELILSDALNNEIDRVEWDNGVTFPDPNGASMALVNPNADNNNGSNWAVSTNVLGSGDFGTPGSCNSDVNPSCGLSADMMLVINEIFQNPSAVPDSSGEWFEIFNPGSTDVDINGWRISDNDLDNHTINNGGALVISAGGFLTLGINGDTGANGGVPIDYVYSGLFLGNSSDELVLSDASDREIDRVEWDNGATFPDPNGASMALIDPKADNNIGSNWAASTNLLGSGDFATPGSCNSDVGQRCIASVPSPATLLLLGLGLAGLAGSRFRLAI